MAAAARLEGVTRRFGAVTALSEVDFELAPGEIHGLLGENGAGKTTLARIMAGLLAPDGGRVEIGGRAVSPGSAAEARSRGVAMVHQHFSLVPRFTGLENVALFNAEAWTRRGAARDGYRAQVEARAAELGLPVALDVPAGRLSVAERQRIEILKALMGETRVLLLDEPTAVLAPQEVDGLFAVLRQVAAAGTGIVLVAHKLDEVLAAAHRVTVLRRGRWVMTKGAAEVTPRVLAEAMVGADHATGAVDSERDAAGAAPATVAALRNVSAASDGDAPLHGVCMTVRRGEILGIAGVGGNGQRTLAAVLAGIRAPDEGEAILPDEVGWIPQDRSGEGLVNDFTITDNVALALHVKREYRRGPWLDWMAIQSAAAALVAEMDVRAGAAGVVAGTLSGGNQQKMVAGREFLRGGDLLVAESPTRGLDVKATVAVRARIAGLVGGGEGARQGPPPDPGAGRREVLSAREGGKRPQHPPGVVLISTDLDEILELADRIAVMVRGRLLPLAPEDHNPAAIGELMLSAGPRGAQGSRDPNASGSPPRGGGAP